MHKMSSDELKCFIIGLLRHCSVLGFGSLFLCLLRHSIISSRFHCFVICFLLQCSSLRLSHPLFVTRHFLFTLFLRHYTIFSRFPLFYYLLITSLLCSRLRPSLPLLLRNDLFRL